MIVWGWVVRYMAADGRGVPTSARNRAADARGPSVLTQADGSGRRSVPPARPLAAAASRRRPTPRDREDAPGQLGASHQGSRHPKGGQRPSKTPRGNAIHSLHGCGVQRGRVSDSHPPSNWGRLVLLGLSNEDSSGQTGANRAPRPPVSRPRWWLSLSTKQRARTGASAKPSRHARFELERPPTQQ